MRGTLRLGLHVGGAVALLAQGGALAARPWLIAVEAGVLALLLGATRRRLGFLAVGAWLGTVGLAFWGAAVPGSQGSALLLALGCVLLLAGLHGPPRGAPALRVRNSWGWVLAGIGLWAVAFLPALLAALAPVAAQETLSAAGAAVRLAAGVAALAAVALAAAGVQARRWHRANRPEGGGIPPWAAPSQPIPLHRVDSVQVDPPGETPK